MANAWDEGNEEFPVTETEDANNPVAQLRKAHERQKKQNEELKAKLAEFETRERERALKELLSAKGLNPKVAQFYQGDADPEKIESWLKDNADVFGLTSEESGQTPAISPELQEAYQQFQTPTQAKANQTVIDQIANFQMNSNEDYDKFMAFMRSNPGAVQNPGAGY
jgi:hypothetical protein